MFETYEQGYPWIVYQYPRPDWQAFILGGLVVCECLICGHLKSVKISRWQIWFPIKDVNYRHTGRDRFLDEHRHPDKCNNRLLWVKPLKNL